MSLLPGLRELRTPLAVGCLWLFIFWMWFADDLERARSSNSGIEQRAAALADSLPRSVTLAALGFLAYLIGTLLSVGQDGYLVRYVQTHTRKYSPLLRPVVDAQLDEFLSNRFELVSPVQPPPAGWGEGLPDGLTSAAIADQRIAPAKSAILDKELPLLENRLHAASVPLFESFDRLRAEGEFRVNLTLPVAALGVTGAISASGWYRLFAFLLLVIAAALLLKGLRRMTISREQLILALASRRIESDYVEVGATELRNEINDYARALTKGKGAPRKS